MGLQKACTERRCLLCGSRSSLIARKMQATAQCEESERMALCPRARMYIIRNGRRLIVDDIVTPNMLLVL